MSPQVGGLHKTLSTIRTGILLCLCVLVVFVSPQLMLCEGFVITLVTHMGSVTRVIVDMPFKLYHILILVITMGTTGLFFFMNKSDVVFQTSACFNFFATHIAPMSWHLFHLGRFFTIL